MADGPCTVDAARQPIDKNTVIQVDQGVSCENTHSGRRVLCVRVRENRERVGQVLGMLSVVDKGTDNTDPPGIEVRPSIQQQKQMKPTEFLDEEMPSSPTDEDDCRKKRCVDRYDSSESSDSGVAVLSCTDCSGSSTSSDITDPGSPFSVASSISEDSGSGKMPPTQNAHHPPWPWATEETSLLKRSTQEKPGYGKRLKVDEETTEEKSPTCLNNNVKTNILVNSISSNQVLPIEETSLNSLKKKKKSGVEVLVPKMQQGKITEYFKSQVIKKEVVRKVVSVKRSSTSPTKNRKITPVSIPRKILPAPSKVSEKMTMNGFHPVTLTAVAFNPSLTYLHTKAPKPPDSIFVPQFTAITDKLNTIQAGCLNIIQPKFTTINNFNNCVKLNATVVPIVKLPSRLNGSNFSVVNVESQTIMTKLETTVTTELKEGQVIAASCEEPATPDSDSGISSKDNLEILVSDEPALEQSQKSPILSQPKTIRFPAKQHSPGDKEKRPHTSDAVVCQWAKCHVQFDTSGALLEHLQLVHVVPQPSQEEQYVCLWVGCKVHGRKSCSRSWLERHVLAHAGTKPFRCIVDGCGMRFNSQLSLQRHVNGHFNSDGSQNNSGKKTMENGSVKLFKRNGKKIRFRRQPWSARMFDFIDSGIMEGMQYRLLTMTERRTLGQFEKTPGDTVTVQSQILARRIEADGKKKVLLRWHPSDILPDEWVNESDFVSKKNVPIAKLDQSAKDELKPLLFPEEQEKKTRRKNHRKQCKPTTT